MLAELDRIEFRPEEWWNGNAHLARVIGSMALLHREISHRYPVHLTPDEWNDILGRIGEPLMAYAAGINDLEGSGERIQAAKTALELFANWFDHFWD
jgi:hypothetical protein